MKKQIRIGVPSISEQLSPYKIFSSDYEICRALFAPLFKLSKAGTILPNIVQQWEEDHNHQEYLLMLREDVFFHNGRNVIAEDVAFTLCRGMMKGARETFSQLLADISGYDTVREQKYYYSSMCPGIQVLDRYCLKIQLKAPNPLFLTYFTRSALSIVPIEEFLEGNLWTWKDKPVGTGAYRFGSINEERKILTLVQHDRHFEKFPDAFDELQFIVYTDIEEVDLVAEIEEDSQEHFEFLQSPIYVTVAIECFMLHDDDKKWRDLRRLICAGLQDCDLFSSFTVREKQMYTPTDGFVPETILAGITDKGVVASLDFSSEKHAFLSKWHEIPPVSVIIYENYTEESHLRRMQNALYDVLVKKGFDVQKTSISSLAQEISDNQQHLLVSSSSFNYNSPEDLSLFFTSDKEIYRANTEELVNIRRLLKLGKREADGEKRKEYYREVARVISQNQLVLPLALTHEYYMFRKTVCQGESFFREFYQPAYEYIIPR